MLQKIFGARKHAPIPTEKQQEEKTSTALKIIHTGGRVELYYMAAPAARIIGNYPAFMLAWPHVFRRPWDAIASPEEILIPGQKYFIVPVRTVKKLKRSIKKPSGNGKNPCLLLTDSQSSMVVSSSIEKCSDDNSPKSNPSFVSNRFGILIKSRSKIKTRIRRVQFFGFDNKQDSDSSEKKQDLGK